MATEEVEQARKALGTELRAFRNAAGYTQQELATRLGYSRPRVAGAEKGDSCALLFWQGCDKLLHAGGALISGYEEIESLRREEARRAAEEARALRRSKAQAQHVEDSADNLGLYGFSVRSHKFIAAYVGADAVTQLAANNACSKNDGQWLACQSGGVAHSSGRCDLHLWPFGVAIFHLVEDIVMPNIASLALWRVRSYDENLAWASQRLRQITGSPNDASYVLSAYWITDPEWPAEQIDSALRVICTPRILLKREPGQVESEQDHAERAERKILAEGYEGSRLTSFGQTGVSIGYASWSGVVYHPISPTQALAEDDLISCELATQAIWAYCEHISQQIESGHDPVVPDQYGWRFLRGTRSRLLNPRAQETGQHRAMRDAIIATSGLTGHLDQAMETLYQMSR